MLQLYKISNIILILGIGKNLNNQLYLEKIPATILLSTFVDICLFLRVVTFLKGLIHKLKQTYFEAKVVIANNFNCLERVLLQRINK